MKGLEFMINVGFIGAGNMGFAIMKGVCESSCSDKISLFTYDIDDEKIKRLEEYGVKSIALFFCSLVMKYAI